jgi:pyruvate/2-oxoglutarate dehydrogenase complex dihydrolipoamide dehydrogenase (E3) component
VASARVAYMARRAAEFGVNTGPVSVDMKKVKARKDGIQRPSQEGAESRLREQKNLDVLKGQARFESSHELSVSDDRLTAEQIFINVGGRAIVPPMPGIDQITYFTNSSIMGVDFLPEHLIVVGGSYIGLEFGQMYRRFGSKVTIVQRAPHLVPKEDEDVSEAIRGIVEKEGITVRTSATCISFEKRGDRILAGVDCEKDSRPAEGTHVLLAVGRKPNTDDLGLEKAGIEHDEQGYIKVDDQLRTNVPGIWALGDCNGHGGFTHTSYNDYEIVAANLLDNDPRRLSDRIQAYNLYIDPPLGRVGMSEADVRKSGRKALIGRYEMSNIGRAREKSETEGFMKVLVDAETKRILGATILGVGGDEIIHSLIDVMYAKAPYTVVSRAVHIHPTVSELIPTMLQQLKSLT